jgi:hypothetical protein
MLIVEMLLFIIRASKEEGGSKKTDMTTADRKNKSI